MLRAEVKRPRLYLLLAVPVVLVTAHLRLPDGLDGWFWSSGFLGSGFRDDTAYASSYSEKAFQAVKKGMSEVHVGELAGPPLKEEWWYEGNDTVTIEDGLVRHISGGTRRELSQLREGTPRERVLAIGGAPLKEVWVYSRSPHDQSYRVRAVVFKGARVTEKIQRFYVD
ncbi:MAG: hypothetical protein ACHQM4_09015 [Thermoanaerobaculia bacterium]